MSIRSRVLSTVFAALCALSTSAAYADALKINTPIFPPFTTGHSAPASATFTVSGGQGNNTYSVTSGTLPPGVTLDPSAGAITGMPTTTGVSVIRVRVKDKSGATASSGPVRIAVNTGVNITIPDLGTVTPGANFQSNSAVVSGGRSPYQISLYAGALPPGFKLATTTGVLGGVSPTAGTYSFRIQAVDADGRVGVSGTLTITIGTPTPVIPPPTPTPVVSTNCGPTDHTSIFATDDYYEPTPIPADTPTKGLCSSGTASVVTFSSTPYPNDPVYKLGLLVECGFSYHGYYQWTCSADGAATSQCEAYTYN